MASLCERLLEMREELPPVLKAKVMISNRDVVCSYQQFHVTVH